MAHKFPFNNLKKKKNFQKLNFSSQHHTQYQSSNITSGNKNIFQFFFFITLRYFIFFFFS